jgi:hypothetical protein
VHRVLREDTVLSVEKVVYRLPLQLLLFLFALLLGPLNSDLNVVNYPIALFRDISYLPWQLKSLYELIPALSDVPVVAYNLSQLGLIEVVFSGFLDAYELFRPVNNLLHVAPRLLDLLQELHLVGIEVLRVVKEAVHLSRYALVEYIQHLHLRKHRRVLDERLHQLTVLIYPRPEVIGLRVIDLLGHYPVLYSPYLGRLGKLACQKITDVRGGGR